MPAPANNAKVIPPSKGAAVAGSGGGPCANTDEATNIAIISNPNIFTFFILVIV